jgi:hypothetical protein
MAPAKIYEKLCNTKPCIKAYDPLNYVQYALAWTGIELEGRVKWRISFSRFRNS